MSKFIDKLTRLSQAAPRSIGFSTTQTASPAKPRMQLVISVTEGSASTPGIQISGADAGLLRISPKSTAKTLQKVSQAMPDIPWGGWLQGDGPEALKQVNQAGSDFVVFSATNTPLAILQDDAVGKIVEVEASLGEGLLRAVNKLPVDAVLVAGEPAGGQSLTWQHLMLFRRLADLLTKPLLVTIPPGVTCAELQALSDAGVNAVVVEITAEQSKDRVKELRQMFDQLTLPSTKRRERIEPRLPTVAQEPSPKPAEEEEEEEQEDE